MTALGIVCCYIMGRSLAWNWLSLVSCVFLVLFTFGLYYIPESPPWLVYNEEEDLAFKSMAMTRWNHFLLICKSSFGQIPFFHLPMTPLKILRAPTIAVAGEKSMTPHKKLKK